jgi:predicted lipoprotein with Yx(FWY)xxD motif
MHILPRHTTGRRDVSRRTPRGAMALAGVLALAAAWAPSATLAQDTVTVATASSDLGTYLVGQDGRTLYYFTRDVTPGRSTCVGGCATLWPPLVVSDPSQLAAGDGVSGTLATFTRDDGTLQVTYRGRPLYYFQNDTAAGQTNGQGLNDIWFVALEDGSLPANPPALTLATASTDLGTFLTGKNGLTTYMFANDTAPGVSTCTGDCATKWPPVTVPAGNTVSAGDGVTGVLGLIPAADGSSQVTYDGHPLYYWQGDTDAGQTNGQGIGGVWFVADVSGDLPAS